MTAQITPLSSARFSNDLFKTTAGGRDLVIKVYRPKPRTFKFYTHRAMALCGFVVPVEYRTESQRKNFEQAVYERWRECGYAVPQLYEVPEVSVQLAAGSVHLILEHIPGPTLDAFLRDAGRSTAEKLDILDQLFRESRQRHERSLKEQDHRLVHFDSNLRNIIVREGMLVHVDFEMGRANEPLVRSIAREIQKVAVEAVTVLGPELLDRVAVTISREYRGIGVTASIIHDASRRVKQMGGSDRLAGSRITRFDLARALARYEGEATALLEPG